MSVVARRFSIAGGQILPEHVDADDDAVAASFDIGDNLAASGCSVMNHHRLEIRVCGINGVVEHLRAEN